MLAKTLVAAALVALAAPTAHAEHATYSCDMESVHVAGTREHHAVVYGTVASAGETVSIRCFITVDGADVGGTGPITAVAVTYVHYEADEDQDLALCAEWTAGAEAGTECRPETSTALPPPVMH